MRLTRAVLLSPLFVLFAAQFAQSHALAATYFVDDNATGDPGPNDPNVSNPLEDGSEAYPFDRIQEALDLAFPQDMVQVLPGEYVEAAVVKHEGVTLRGHGRGVTVVRSPSGTALVADRVSSFPGLEMRVFVEGFTFVGSVLIQQVDAGGLKDVEILSGDLWATSNNLPQIPGATIDVSLDSVSLADGDLFLSYCYDALINFSITRFSGPTSHVSFSGCTDAFAGLRISDSTVASIEAGNYFGGYRVDVERVRFTGIGLRTGHAGSAGHLTVIDSVFEAGGVTLAVGGGVTGGGLVDDSLVRGCTFINGGILYHYGFSFVEPGMDTLTLTLEGNRFVQTRFVILFSGISEGFGSSRIRIANNVFDSASSGLDSFWDMRDAGLGTRPQEIDLEVVNNTFHDSAAGIRLAVRDHVTGMDSLTALVQNNIVSGGEVGLEVIGGDDLQLSLIANDFFGQSGDRYRGEVVDPTGQNGNISADPLLADPAVGDFTLQHASPCVDAGQSGSEVPQLDHAGVSRPQDGNSDGVALPDIGAYELVLVDEDGDGFPAGIDCDDADPAVHPSAPELPGNLHDENCDGAVSCDPSGDWRNHGAFVRCVGQTCGDLVDAGAVSSEQCQRLVSDAALSDVGR